MHNEIWGRAKISPKQLTSVDDLAQFPRKPNWVKFPHSQKIYLFYNSMGLCGNFTPNWPKLC